jgi:peptide deformylase
MALLPLVYAPHPVFRQKAEPIGEIDAAVRALAADMTETMYAYDAVGIGANMVGVLRRIAVVDLREGGARFPYVLINPEVLRESRETQTNEEASLSFPYISAPVTRPKAIGLRYRDAEGAQQELEAEGFLAAVMLHEIDYLDGRTFLDRLSRAKREMLTAKMLKKIRQHPPHVHGAHCRH